MKKCVVFILLLSLLVGCGKTEKAVVNESDEKTAEVTPSEVSESKEADSESVMYVYNVDGQVKSIPVDSYEEKKGEGWYDKPVTKVFSKDGKSKIVPKEDVGGWEDRDEWDIYMEVHTETGETKNILSKTMFEEQENSWYVDPRDKARSAPLKEVEYSPNGTNISLSQACQIAKNEADRIFEYDEETQKSFEILGFDLKELHEPYLVDFSPGAYLISVGCFTHVEFFSVNKTTGYVFHCGGGQDYWAGMVAF